ncbi:unnamed protein product [Brugia timori]|uniref:Uncharacterized protein n=1 Tax=Brugia timori TaxID=42155 RepID=A0A3P7T2H7_9BILA|nr:unnamed protein product [Brugia timori]
MVLGSTFIWHLSTWWIWTWLGTFYLLVNKHQSYSRCVFLPTLCWSMCPINIFFVIK